MSEARDFSIVMAYEAFRICLGLPTRKHKPSDVLRWMRLILRAMDSTRARSTLAFSGNGTAATTPTCLRASTTKTSCGKWRSTRLISLWR
jgi:hypothetical protein